jgi:hypothetical protein
VSVAGWAIVISALAAFTLLAAYGGRLPVRDHAWVESMVVRVLGFDCVHVGDFEVGSYTVFADGTLRLDLADGSEKTLDWEEWIDIRQIGIADEWAMKNPKQERQA